MFKITVNVEGMMCKMCEAHVNEAITNAINPKEVSSSHSKNTTEIITDEEPDKDVIINAIKNTGYEVKGYTIEPYVKKKILGFL